MAKLLQRTNLRERLKDALVRESQIDPLTEVLKATKATARCARVDD